MTCERCDGLMVPSKLWDEMIAVDIPSHYCLNCGNITDRVIMLNRRTVPFPASQSAR